MPKEVREATWIYGCNTSETLYDDVKMMVIWLNNYVYSLTLIHIHIFCFNNFISASVISFYKKFVPDMFGLRF